MALVRDRMAVMAVTGTVLAVVLLSQPVGAGSMLNTIDDTATLNPGGHSVVVTGPVRCTEGETMEIRVTVTQESTDAVARGSTHLRCTGERQQWAVHAATRGPDGLQGTSAHVDAWGQTRFRGAVTDTTDEGWERDVTLVRR